MARSHKGLQEYAGNEVGNVSLGQKGWKLVQSTGDSGNGFFAAVKVLGDDNSTAKATLTLTMHQGDNVTGAVMLAGDILYGPFKKIDITANTGNCDVLCYYG